MYFPKQSVSFRYIAVVLWLLKPGMSGGLEPSSPETMASVYGTSAVIKVETRKSDVFIYCFLELRTTRDLPLVERTETAHP